MVKTVLFFMIKHFFVYLETRKHELFLFVSSFSRYKPALGQIDHKYSKTIKISEQGGAGVVVGTVTCKLGETPQR
jgi:hypothetical protein